MTGGTAIHLRPWKEADVAAMKELRNDVPLQAQLLARARGSDDAQVRQWLKDRSSNEGSTLSIIADRGNDQALGFIQFTGIDAIDRRAEMGVCLARPAQGKGFGTQAIRMALDHVREDPGLRKVGVRVRADNAGAIRCYTKIGFERCGLLRRHASFEGVWHDVVLMEIFLQPGA